MNPVEKIHTEFGKKSSLPVKSIIFVECLLNVMPATKLIFSISKLNFLLVSIEN